MTQLARLDLARYQSGRDYAPADPDSATAEPSPGDLSGLLRAGPPVAGWVVGAALLAPAVLVGGWLIGGALQPASYSPMRQTMSALAGHSGTDPWVMTAALVLTGGCQIATGAGLAGVRLPARILLILTGLSTLGIAASPEPATGPTSRHLAFAVSCVVTTAVWPVVVARRAPAQPWILGAYGCATVALVFAGLSCWLLIAARGGGGDLGMVERLTSTVQGLFPLVVALALRRTARKRSPAVRDLRAGGGSPGRRGVAGAGNLVLIGAERLARTDGMAPRHTRPTVAQSRANHVVTPPRKRAARQRRPGRRCKPGGHVRRR